MANFCKENASNHVCVHIYLFRKSDILYLFQIENDLANERNTIVFKLDVVCTRQEGRIKNATGHFNLFDDVGHAT